MEGVIDLVVKMKSGEWWIIDWKTNRPSTSTHDDFEQWITEHYRPQLEAYTQVCRQHCGTSPVRAGLYLTVSGRYCEV
jgi:ATP-dependent exoDNAse (exonuclease V) beta subunit